MLAYASLLHFVLIGNLLLVGIAGAVAALTSGRRRRWALVITLLILILSVVFWGSLFLFTGVKREIGFDMTWSYGNPAEHCPQSKHIILRFKCCPNHAVGIYSPDLGDYLETLPSHDVHVVFEITTDFGRMRGFNELQIAGLRSWQTCDSYYSVSGDSEPSPWP
jgi:hypothetical protein